MGIIVLFPIAIGLALLLKRRFEEVVFPAIGLITIPIVITCSFGSANLGYYLVLIMAGIFFLFSVIRLIKNKEGIREYVFTPGMISFVCIIPLLYCISRGRVFTSEEALRYLGPAAKELFLTSKLVLKDNFYPYTSFWAFFNLKLTGKFSEEICIFSNEIYILSGAMPILRYQKYNKSFLGCFAISLIVILFPIIKLSDSYIAFDYYAPQIAALIFAFCNVVNKRNSSVCLAYGIFASCIFSEFGVLQLFPIFIYMIAKRFGDKRKLFVLLRIVVIGYAISMIPEIIRLSAGNGSLQALMIRIIVFPWAIAVGIAISFMVKQIHKYNKIMALLISISIIMSSILAGAIFIIGKKNTNNWGERIYKFSEFLFNETDEKYLIGLHLIHLPDITFILLSIITIGTMRLFCKKRGNKQLYFFDLINFSVLSGIAIYIVFYAFLWIGSEDTAEDITYRIISGNIAPIISLLVLLIIYDAILVWGKSNCYVFPASLLFLLLLTYGDPIQGIFYREKEQRIYYDDLESTEFKFSDKVFFLDKVDRSQEAPAVFVWSVFPAGTGTIDGYYFNPDPLKYTDDIEKQLTYQELTKLVKEEEYDYVYLRNIDDNFRENYWPVFVGWEEGIFNDTLYKVEFTSEGYLLLDAIIDKESNNEGDS